MGTSLTVAVVLATLAAAALLAWIGTRLRPDRPQAQPFVPDYDTRRPRP